MGTGNYGATWNNMKLAPPSPLLAVPNVTTYPSTASVLITVLLYNGPLLCGVNVRIKGLKLLLHSAGGYHQGEGFTVGRICGECLRRGGGNL